MKKGKKFIIGIVLITFGVVGLFGLFGNTDDKAALAGGSVLLIAGGAALVYLDKKNPATATKNTVSAPAPAIVPAANVAPADRKSLRPKRKAFRTAKRITIYLKTLQTVRRFAMNMKNLCVCLTGRSTISPVTVERR